MIDSNNLFTPILADEEEIQKIYKPDKKRFSILAMMSGIPISFVACIFYLFAFLMLFRVIKVVDEVTGEPTFALFPAIFLIIFGSIPLTIAIITVVRQFAIYKNTYYAVTNKRVIMRTGAIGVDYKSLNIDAILSVDVNVGPIDRMIKPNTGTIVFGNAMNSNVPTNGNASYNRYMQFAFIAINNPYDTAKEIKSIIDEFKGK